jgi:hypothetical protein
VLRQPPREPAAGPSTAGCAPVWPHLRTRSSAGSECPTCCHRRSMAGAAIIYTPAASAVAAAIRLPISSPNPPSPVNQHCFREAYRPQRLRVRKVVHAIERTGAVVSYRGPAEDKALFFQR